MIIVITDGDPDFKEQTLSNVDTLRQKGREICAVMVGSGNEQYLNKLTGGCYSEARFETLSEELMKLDICL